MFLEKADKQFLLLKKDYAVTLQILFLRGISRWWKVIKIFLVSLSGNMAQLKNFMGLLIFPFKWGGLSFPSSTVWKSRSCLYVNKHATCDFKISSPVTASLLRTCEHFGLRLLRGLAFDFRFSVFGFRQKYKLVFKFFPVCLWSERQLSASTELQQPRNANIIERNAWQTKCHRNNFSLVKYRRNPLQCGGLRSISLWIIAYNVPHAPATEEAQGTGLCRVFLNYEMIHTSRLPSFMVALHNTPRYSRESDGVLGWRKIPVGPAFHHVTQTFGLSRKISIFNWHNPICDPVLDPVRDLIRDPVRYPIWSDLSTPKTARSNRDENTRWSQSAAELVLFCLFCVFFFLFQ